jgi:hypothetical protein
MIIFKGGSNLTENITITDNDDNPIDITADTLTFYLKYSLSDMDAQSIFTTTLLNTDPTNGIAQIIIPQALIVSLSDRYYPYIIKRVSGGQTYFVDMGVLNINQIYNQWEWDTDVLEGVSLSSLQSQANNLLRYRDWDSSLLLEWANDGVKDFCKQTNYLISRVGMNTKKNSMTYQLPKDLITIRNVFLDERQIYRNRGWIRENNTLILTGEPEGNKRLEIICSKYAQPMDNVNQYAEVVQEANEGIVYYICWKAKLQDREFGDADYYLNLYNEYVNAYTTKNTIDSTEETQLTYVGQGATLNSISNASLGI